MADSQSEGQYTPGSPSVLPATFDALVASRRAWIEHVLKPWCRRTTLADLKRAELEWADIAGRIDAKATLWQWAWSRFPDLVHEGLPGVNETYEVRVTLKNEQTCAGYPDSRQSTAGRLVLISGAADAAGRRTQIGPLSIDDIATVTRL